jgi:hypothetical protein
MELGKRWTVLAMAIGVLLLALTPPFANLCWLPLEKTDDEV